MAKGYEVQFNIMYWVNVKNCEGSHTVPSSVSADLNTLLGQCSAQIIYRVSQEECEILRESVPYVKLYRYNPKHLYPKLNGYGDNGKKSLKL